MRAIQIVGIGHGGTTIMDRVLSAYPGVIGLSESEQVWKKIKLGTLRDEQTCACGERHATCPYWSRVLSEKPATPQAYYRRVVETARDLGFSTVVDASKNGLPTTNFEALRAEGLVSEAVQLRLIRDPRGWVTSMMKRDKMTADDVNGIRGLFYRWLFTHVKLDGKAKPHACAYVWYDKLVIQQSTDHVAKALGLDVPAEPVSLSRTTQHALVGNNLLRSSGRERLHYDGSWMESTVLDEVYAELPPVRAYYHEVQKLHLTRDQRITANWRALVDVQTIEAAADSGDWTEVAAQAALLKPVAHIAHGN